MEASQHLLNEVVSPGALEDVFLAGVLVEDLVEGVRLHVVHLVGDSSRQGTKIVSLSMGLQGLT